MADRPDLPIGSRRTFSDYGPTSLEETVRDVRERQANRDDVVVEMTQAERGRLKLLAEDLRSFADELNPTDERFEFALSQGERPRFWIDVTTHVAMHPRDPRTYVFQKDTRLGRLVLSESENRDLIAQDIRNYVAERILERERALEGDWHYLYREKIKPSEDKVQTGTASEQAEDIDEASVSAVTEEVSPEPRNKGGVLRTLTAFLLLLSILVAVVLTVVYVLFPESLPSLDMVRSTLSDGWSSMREFVRKLLNA